MARSPGMRRLGGAVVAATLAVTAVAPRAIRAQPTPELVRAKDLYRSAEAAMHSGRFGDAIRNYSLSYDLSKDPALLYKIGHANELAGKCSIALLYYERYLREGAPAEQFIATTNERIAACGGTPGSSASAASTGAAAPTPPDEAGAARGNTGAASTGSAANSSTASGLASSAAPTPVPSNPRKVAWLLTGSGLALVTLGGVLGYAASSSENDVRDLYLGLNGLPPSFDGQTRARYNQLIDQGHRYEHLSWASFGVAGAAAVAAAVLFARGGHDEPAPHARITATATGLAVSF